MLTRGTKEPWAFILDKPAQKTSEAANWLLIFHNKNYSATTTSGNHKNWRKRKKIWIAEKISLSPYLVQKYLTATSSGPINGMKECVDKYPSKNRCLLRQIDTGWGS